VFHGTRKSNLARYRLFGVDPWWAPNQFSPGPAFHVTTSLKYAYAYALSVHPRSDDVAPDPIVVLAFAINSALYAANFPHRRALAN
jgi:hypothetical protein